MLSINISVCCSFSLADKPEYKMEYSLSEIYFEIGVKYSHHLYGAFKEKHICDGACIIDDKTHTH